MNEKRKKLLSVLVTTAFCVTSVVPAFAVEPPAENGGSESVPAPEEEFHKDFQIKYESDAGTFSKISHPEFGTNTRKSNPKINDGIVDYLGQGKVGVPGVDAGAENQGDRGQNYSWASVAYGDWMYVSTCFNAMMNTVGLMGDAGLGHNMDINEMKKTLNALYNGDFFVEEPDGANTSGVLCKINVKTGEVKILKKKVLFRNAVVYKDQIYFCGSNRGLPCIYKINPENDEMEMVYADTSVNVQDLPGLIKNKKICPAIRGISTFRDSLVISCVGEDANPYIAVTNADDPHQNDFKIVAKSYKDGTDNTEKGELLGYPACRIQDAIYGGSIWEMTEFNDKLYVALCTGRGNDVATDIPDKLQSFALMKGECNGDPTVKENWTWTPVIGDQVADGAKYTFGIDPERDRAAACNICVYDNHLYIGEYNDTEVALIDVLMNKDATFLAENLKQSVSLYRMDANENIEKVMGDPTDMFPKALSGINQSGFGKHSNQYIWRSATYDNKYYLGTLDEGSLLYPLSRFAPSEIIGQSAAEWTKELNQAVTTMETIVDDPDSSKGQVTEKDVTVMNQMLDQVKQAPLKEDAGTPDPSKYAPKKGAEAFSADILKTDRTMDVTGLTDLPKALVQIGALLEQDPNWTLDERLVAHAEFYHLYDKALKVYTDNRAGLPPEIQGILDQILTPENIAKARSFIRCFGYLQGTVDGFDMYVSGDGTSLTRITNNGMGDPYNHGLRAFAINDSKDNPWLAIGTANPFYGTQVWRLDNENVLPKPGEPEGPEGPVDPEGPEVTPPNPSPNIPSHKPSKPNHNNNKHQVIMFIGSEIIMVDNDKKTIDCAPMIQENRTFVPFRALAEGFGAKVDYIDETCTIETVLNGTKVVMTIGSDTYTVNGKECKMDVAPFIKDSRTMVPVRFIAEAFGIEVDPVYKPDGTTANVIFTK